MSEWGRPLECQAKQNVWSCDIQIFGQKAPAFRIQFKIQMSKIGNTLLCEKERIFGSHTCSVWFEFIHD